MSPRSSRLSPLSRAARSAALCAALALVGCSGEGIDWEQESSFSSDPPRQVNPSASPQVQEEDVTLVPRATYRLDALVMSRRDYDRLLRGDELSHVVPMDLALAWGPAAHPDVQETLSVRQSGRWFFWRYAKDKRPPVSHSQLVSSMANVHIIPADVFLAEKLRQVEEGSCYRFGGDLVDIESSDPRLKRRTSLTRTDSGAGACEIFRVEEVARIECPQG